MIFIAISLNVFSVDQTRGGWFCMSCDILTLMECGPAISVSQSYDIVHSRH